MEARLDCIAAEKVRSGDRLGARWYQARADALHAPFVARADRCGEDRRLELHCPACGQWREREVSCGLRHWCPDCIKERARREYKRLIPALDAREREERATWFARGNYEGAPQLRLLTLTVRHGASLEETREAIARAWPRFRRSLGHLLGEAFHEPRRSYVEGRTGKTRYRKAHRRAPFCGIWEVADKSHAQGHPHLHVCVILPWIDVRELARLWVAATDGKAEAQGLDLRSVKSREAARYVAAYVTSATLDDDLQPEVAAAWVRTTYARRLVQASRAFWLKDEHRARCDCGTCLAPVPRVISIREPSALEKAFARPPPRAPLPALKPVFLPPENRSYKLADMRSDEEKRFDFVD